jgi:hypothetical protein
LLAHLGAGIARVQFARKARRKSGQPAVGMHAFGHDDVGKGRASALPPSDRQSRDLGFLERGQEVQGVSGLTAHRRRAAAGRIAQRRATRAAAVTRRISCGQTAQQDDSEHDLGRPGWPPRDDRRGVTSGRGQGPVCGGGCFRHGRGLIWPAYVRGQLTWLTQIVSVGAGGLL